ncbi:phosphoglycerate mutase [Maritimibacter sp. 55A14]|uniref:SixA phosphatase family protein n=1 Tax=Maritimibacter sp. 55A14 TaxID=2174844 RepID=UPI000D620319|nr:histidine phosphatase family protein [Maritimibacter sp. 55A14]PWE32728.1 phosphoglycerate mutase [Maritimibacter sp. 55A14]
MRRLILTRHAKSSWSATGPADHDRPLNGRGRKAASRIGDWLTARGYLPDELLCSTAQRARETWNGMAPALAGPQPRAEYLRGLYMAAPIAIQDALRGASGECVLLICHNPGIGAFAHAMPRHLPEHMKFGKYPTGATLVLEFDLDDWRDVQPGTGEILDFIVPRDLD